jgi:hypothetical protein
MGWRPFDIERRPADVIERELLAACSGLAGLLIVVNDTSYELRFGPFFVNASQLADFVRDFGDRAADYITNGDLFIVAPANGIVVVVREDGYIARLQGRPTIV